jgi:hypothetical protein
MYQQLWKKLWGCCNGRSWLEPSGVLMNGVSGFTVIDIKMSLNEQELMFDKEYVTKT